MRPRFEADLQNYNKIVKKEIALEDKIESSEDDLEVQELNSELDKLSHVADFQKEEAAISQRTGPKTQEIIYDLQREKQEIMQEMKDDLECLRNPDCSLEKMEGDRLASYDGEKFIYENDSNQKLSATFGDVLTDMEWGITYHFDRSSVPVHFIKKYIVERTKKELLDLLDKQIIISEVTGNVIESKRKAIFKIVHKERESGASKEKWGFISEVIVKNFLKKLSVDFDLPFSVKEADVYQDVEQKIDFIIHREQRKRGVNVDANDQVKDIGVQFTVNDSAKQHKEKQIEKSLIELREEKNYVQDIALVVFPLSMVMDLKHDWELMGRPSGGPEGYLKRNTAKYLFASLLKDVFTQDEIAEYWERVKGNFYTTSKAA